jgi:hypothetical protein
MSYLGYPLSSNSERSIVKFFQCVLKNILPNHDIPSEDAMNEMLVEMLDNNLFIKQAILDNETNLKKVLAIPQFRAIEQTFIMGFRPTFQFPSKWYRHFCFSLGL